MDPILEIIDAALKEKGLSDAAASKLAVGHPSLIKNMRLEREGQKRYNLPSLARLAGILDLEFYFGPKRPPTPLGLSESESDSDFDKPTPSRMGYLPIPWTVPGLGLGSAPISIQRDYLAKHGLIPGRLSAVVPDAVLLTLPTHGPYVAILDARVIRRGHGLWCFSEGKKTTVAHVTFHQAGMIVPGASPATPARLISIDEMAMVNILGRVVMLNSLIGV